jgi:hypothetical protein
MDFFFVARALSSLGARALSPFKDLLGHRLQSTTKQLEPWAEAMDMPSNNNKLDILNKAMPLQCLELRSLQQWVATTLDSSSINSNNSNSITHKLFIRHTTLRVELILLQLRQLRLYKIPELPFLSLKRMPSTSMRRSALRLGLGSRALGRLNKENKHKNR